MLDVHSFYPELLISVVCYYGLKVSTQLNQTPRLKTCHIHFNSSNNRRRCRQPIHYRKAKFFAMCYLISAQYTDNFRRHILNFHCRCQLPMQYNIGIIVYSMRFGWGSCMKSTGQQFNILNGQEGK